MEKLNPEILVYRRTHRGDPNIDGVFGCHDCMGSVRNIYFDAVIGIGGAKPWPGSEGIAFKINWIGIGPTKSNPSEQEQAEGYRFRGQLVTFNKFLLLNDTGPLLKDIAPSLYHYMFVEHRIPRYAKNFSKEIYVELKQIILTLAEDALPSGESMTKEKLIPLSKSGSCSTINSKNKGCA